MKVFNVDYTPHLSYDPTKKNVPQNTLNAYNDIIEQMKILNPDKVFLQTADDKMTLHAYDRNAIDEQAGKE